MSLLRALFLGLLQGFTEFLPISSSGHITIVPFILGWAEPTLAFNVAVHAGTLLAVMWFFRERVGALIRSALRYRSATAFEQRMLKLVIIGTIPAALVGGALGGPISNVFERPVPIVFLMAFTAWLLMSTETRAERRGTRGRTESELREADAAVVGVGQALSVLPGISRSGATIAFAMRMGLTRTDATRYSFLLAIPILIGAILIQIPDILEQGLGGEGDAFAVAFVASFASGLLAIRWFLGIVERRGLRPFGYYLIFASIAGALAALARG